MKAVVVRIKLLQPLLVTRPGGGEENSSDAYSFIPGSVIRGALIGRYMELNPADKEISKPKDGKPRPFFDGSCCFLNGYPVDRSGNRMLPAPLSWQSEKSPTSDYPTVYDFAVSESGPKEPAGVKKEFASLVSKGKVELDTPERFMQVHNASLGRGIKEKGRSFVYRYETLAEGREFEAAVVGEGAHHLFTELMNISPGMELRLGGSRSANYGRVKLTSITLVADWKETSEESNDDGMIIVTLLSDAILTGSYGQPVSNLDDLLSAKCQKAFTRPRLVGGFNRKWGLPLPQAEALQAGSVFVYPGEPEVKRRLSEMVESGIGERRVEGFGRVAVNWQRQPYYRQLQPSEILPTDTKDNAVPQPTLVREDSKALAARMAERQAREVLDLSLAKALSQLTIEKPPQASQLSRLRAAARLALQKKDLAVIPVHVSSLKSAADQLERARVVDMDTSSNDRPIRLNEWLTKHILSSTSNSEENWTVWSKYLKLGEGPVVAGVRLPRGTMEKLEIEYTARLLDALFRQTTRKVQDKRGGTHDSTME